MSSGFSQFFLFRKKIIYEISENRPTVFSTMVVVACDLWGPLYVGPAIYERLLGLLHNLNDSSSFLKKMAR